MAWTPDTKLSDQFPLAPELMARVRKIHLRTHRLVNTALSGGYRSTFHGSGIEFEEVRPYMPGDDVRRIDWNVTARNDEAYIKSFREERELTVNLLVDTASSMDFGSGRFTKREAAAQFCALIALVALRHQDRVGLTLFGSQAGMHLPPAKGNKHVLRVIREVVASKPDSLRSDLAKVLEDSVRAIRRRSMVFVISDFLGIDGQADAPRGRSWSDLLARLNSRHDVICVRVVDPFEERLPDVGLFKIREVGTGRVQELDTRSKVVREAWQEDASRRRRELSQALSRARVDMIEINADDDVSLPVMRFFKRRELRHQGGIA